MKHPTVNDMQDALQGVQPNDGDGDVRHIERSKAEDDVGSLELENPPGAVPAISSGAIGLVAVLVAFVAYADFRVSPDGSWGDLPPIAIALCAAAFLAAVPFLATSPERANTPVRKSAMHAARRSFAIGAGCAILAIVWFVVRSLLTNHA